MIVLLPVGISVVKIMMCRHLADFSVCVCDVPYAWWFYFFLNDRLEVFLFCFVFKEKCAVNQWNSISKVVPVVFKKKKKIAQIR